MNVTQFAVVCAMLGVLLIIVIAPYAKRFRERVRESDERARANRRRRERVNAEMRDAERRADLQAAIHRRMRGAQ